MGGTAGTKVAYFTAGVVVAGAIGGLLITGISVDDEERPPIIVKGGSLIFEGGDRDSGEATETKGKPWLQVQNDWQPDHTKGIPVTKFTLAIRGGSQGSCPALERTKEVTVTYTKDGTASSFTITTKPRPTGSGKPAPTIVGSGLQKGGTADNPQLIYGTPGEGGITRVQFRGMGGNVDCQGTITSVKVWQDR